MITSNHIINEIDIKKNKLIKITLNNDKEDRTIELDD